MKKIRAIIRGLLVFPLALLTILPGLIKLLFSKNWLPLALRMRRYWANISLSILGVKIEYLSEIPAGGPFIFVGNHRSYLDPIVALKDIEALPIAKAEVSSWPIIGYGAKATGILYVKRESKSSRANTLKAMEKMLKEGYSVLVYPEGTTHIEPITHNFQRGAFRLAAELNIPIVPMAIEYMDKGDAWIGDETFLPHFMRCFGKKRAYIKMAYGPSIKNKNANDMMMETKSWINDMLQKMNG